jgi:hypothetical protein
MSNIRQKALIWMRVNKPEEIINDFRASKFFPDKDIWFFTFPTDFFDSSMYGSINLLLQDTINVNKFIFLKIPYSFFRKNKHKFKIRNSKDKFDLNISGKSHSWLQCQISRDIDFREFEQ